MLRSGLVSISFRSLSVAEVIGLTASAHLSAVEWGGDIHVPPGDLSRARETAARTRDAGLRVAAYGSYYQAAGRNNLPFEAVLETAAALGAPTLRVWAGPRGSADCPAAERQAVVEDLLRVAAMSAQAGIVVACENHRDTLTDSTESLRLLLTEADHPNLRFYWQPLFGLDRARNLDNLATLLPRLEDVHAFHWTPDRRPLAEGSADWTAYLHTIRQTFRDHFILLEFMPDDAPASCGVEAATLTKLLGETQP